MTLMIAYISLGLRLKGFFSGQIIDQRSSPSISFDALTWTLSDEANDQNFLLRP